MYGKQKITFQHIRNRLYTAWLKVIAETLKLSYTDLVLLFVGKKPLWILVTFDPLKNIQQNTLQQAKVGLSIIFNMIRDFKSHSRT